MNIKEKELLIDQMEEQLHRAYMMNHHVSASTCNPWRHIPFSCFEKAWETWWKSFTSVTVPYQSEDSFYKEFRIAKEDTLRRL
jgi:hypothetical protein